MKRLIRGMAGLAIVLGASACAEDYSLDFGGEPTQLQATPYAMFINQGVTEEVYVRLINDRNQSIPMDVTVSNVGSGITVEVDRTYRPDNAGSDSLAVDPLQIQHRVLVTADAPTKTTFRLTSGSHSTDVTVQVVPNTIGALSNAAPAVGEEVTISAPAGLSFTTEGDNASTVTFSPGGAAVITNRTANSISFYPIPGSAGEATVTHVNIDYAPTIGDRTLITSNEIDVPAVTSIPLAYSSTTPGQAGTVTVTATGFRFRPNSTFSYNGQQAFVLSVAEDGTSATILPPANLAGATAEVSQVNLANLPEVALTGLASTTAITTVGYPAGNAGGTNLGNAPVINAAAPGTGVFLAEAGPLNFGPDVNYLGGNNAGAPRYYRLNVTTAGSYRIAAGWTSGGDYDLYLRNAADDATIASAPTGANPEAVTATLAVGTYYIVFHNWHGDAPNPQTVLITVK